MKTVQKYDEVFQIRNALTDIQIKAFCLKNKIPYHYCDLKKLSENMNDLPASCFVFTGNKKDEFNNGYSEHWLYLFGNHLFDSYSFQQHYTLNPSISFVKLFPKQLQEFNSVVCGEYCLAIAHYVATQDYEEGEVGIDFCNHYGFTKNKHQNDETVYTWYEENKD